MTTVELIAKCRDKIAAIKRLRQALGRGEWSAGLFKPFEEEPDWLWTECLDRLEKAEADARRYRRIFECGHGSSYIQAIWNNGWSKQEVDAAIDAEMAQEVGCPTRL